MHSFKRSRNWLSAAAMVLGATAEAKAQGLYLPGGGAAHMSMAGASTASPIDAIGALYWNPAAIGKFGRNEVEVGGAFLFPNFSLESTAPGPFGPRTGSTKSDSGTSVTSNLGIVFQPEQNPITYGLGINMLGGGGINFPGDINNPILSGVGPLGNVQGPIAANLILMQMTPTAAYKLTDRLIVGIGPTIDIAITSFDPAFFGSPDDSNGDGIGQFPSGAHSRPYWGGGVRAGLVYSMTDQLDLGFGYTSPQWFEPWIYHARTELGLPRTLVLNVTLPAIYSWGASYLVTERWRLSTDLRYFDYANTDLYGTPVAQGGLGWKSVFAAAFGTRYQVTDKLAVSGGYIYNDNPISAPNTLFNVQSPLITQNTITLGSTMNVTDGMAISVGYAYAFQNSISGTVREATGYGTKITADAHMLTFSMQFKFGGDNCCHKPAPCGECASSSSVTATEPTRNASTPPGSIGG